MALSRTGSKLFAKPQTYTRNPMQPPSPYGQTPTFTQSARSPGERESGYIQPSVIQGASVGRSVYAPWEAPEHYMDSWNYSGPKASAQRRMFQQTSPQNPMPMIPGSGRGGPSQMPASQPGPSSTAPANWGEWANEFGQNLSAMGQHKFVGLQNPMQPPVDLSGMQGAPTSLGVGLAGMMPGYGGMAAQGALAGYGKGYMMSKWMQDNPESRMTQSPPGQGQSVRALNAITDAPQPQNSLQAATIADNNPMMNRAVAGMSNGYYSPPSSVSQGREYGLTLPMDQAGMENRISNQNPMYEGMQGRFGDGSVIGQQAATIAAGDAGVAAGTHVDIPGSYGEMPTYIEKRQEPEVKYRSNKNGDQVSYVDNTDLVLGRQFNALRDFKANPERGANRKAAREATKARLADSRFKMMVGKGMNPNSAKAKAMFPEQTGGGLNKNNSMVAAGPPGSIEDRMGAASQVQQDLTSNPHLLALGMTPESTMSDLNSAVGSHLDNGGALTDESLKALQQHAMAQSRLANKENDPFQFGQSSSAALESGMWRMLASAPDTPEARSQWANVFSARKAALTAQQKKEYDNLPRTKPSATTNPGYAAPLAPTAY